MQKLIDKVVPLVVKVDKVAVSWWVLGLIGWAIVVWMYPIDAALPRYAGG